MTDRRIYEITGSDALTFLQGMTSNDVLPLAKAHGIVWTALLTPQGKYLADFFVVNTGTHLLLDIKESIADTTLRRLAMYKLRADVGFTTSDLKLSRTPDTGFADPRHPALGARSYALDATETPTDWDALRVTHCIPETGIELIPDDSYLLENGFERLHGVDFRKGCYVGQEVTARMKHKTELRKGLVRVRIDGSAPVGTEITAGEKTVGKLFTQSGDHALAYLRLDQATGTMQAGTAQLWLE